MLYISALSFYEYILCMTYKHMNYQYIYRYVLQIPRLKIQGHRDSEFRINAKTIPNSNRQFHTKNVFFFYINEPFISTAKKHFKK